MNTCTHSAKRNGYCVVCLHRPPTLNDALLTDVWRASVRRLKAGRPRPVTTKRIVAIGCCSNGQPFTVRTAGDLIAASGAKTALPWSFTDNTPVEPAEMRGDYVGA